MRWTVWTLLMMALVSCATTSSGSAPAIAAPRKESTMEIQQLLQSYEQALNASDTEAVMKLYGASPVFMPQHAPAMVGRDAVRQSSQGPTGIGYECTR